MADEYMVKTVNLTKSYNRECVVKDACINVKVGEIYGFVGPNGAGKSTILKMLMNLIEPDAGEIQIIGQKVENGTYEYRRQIGSIIESPFFYEKLTAQKNLELHCKYMNYNNLERIDEAMSFR